MKRYLGLFSILFIGSLVVDSAEASISAPTTSSGSHTVSWSPLTGADGYELVQTGPQNQTFWVSSATSFSVSNLPSGTYTYTVNYYNLITIFGESEWIGPIATGYAAVNTVVSQAPNAPTGVSVSSIGAPPDASYNGTANVHWTASSGATSYKVEHRANSGSWVSSTVTSTSKGYSGLVNGAHEFRVRACAGSACGPYAAPVSLAADQLPNLSAVSILAVGETGSLPFSTGTSPGGSSLIDIPIDVPSGPNKLSHALTLSYASTNPQSAIEENEVHGLLGYGWGVTGLSFIGRCRVGVGGVLTFSSADHLCMDGEQLIPVSGGAIWSDGVELRPINQPATKVIARGAGIANRWWEVYDANGGVHRFGETAPARAVDLNSNVVITWGLEKTTDDFSNVKTISYHRNSVNGLIFPKEIAYGSVAVQFFYQVRNDNGQITQSNLSDRAVALNHINVRMANKMVRQYRIKSSYSGERLRLDKVQLCGYDINGQNRECLVPVSFSWQTLSTTSEAFKNVVNKVENGLGETWEFSYSVIDGQNPTHALNIGMSSTYGTFTAPAGIFTRDEQRALVSQYRMPDGKIGRAHV